MVPMTERAADAAIIERSLREPECFAELFDRYHAPIHGYAERRLTRPLADDIAAETFLIAFRRRDTYDLSRPDARPWLYGIASIADYTSPAEGITMNGDQKIVTLGGGSHTIKKGTILTLSVRLAIGITDKPGVRP